MYKLLFNGQINIGETKPEEAFKIFKQKYCSRTGMTFECCDYTILDFVDEMFCDIPTYVNLTRMRNYFRIKFLYWILMNPGGNNFELDFDCKGYSITKKMFLLEAVNTLENFGLLQPGVMASEYYYSGHYLAHYEYDDMKAYCEFIIKEAKNDRWANILLEGIKKDCEEIEIIQKIINY